MKSQDIIVAVKLLILNGKSKSFAELSKDLKISVSEVHAAVKRLEESFLLDPLTGKIRKPAIKEFLIHGIKYTFPAILKNPARGMLTGYTSPFMKNDFNSDNVMERIVWPYSFGNDRGNLIDPLYKTAPDICMIDQQIYHWLTIIDIFRMNRARECEIATKHLEKLLSEPDGLL